MRAKDFLMRARGIEAEIRSIKESEREAWERATNITPNYDGDVTTGTKDPHKFDGLVEYLETLCRLEDELDKVKNEVLCKIYRLHNSNERQVLKAYYVDCKRWEKISVDMHFSYRNVLRIHARGLKHIEEVLNADVSCV